MAFLCRVAVAFFVGCSKVEQPFVKSFIEGTLPSIILTQFLNHLPSILRATSIYEGHISMSTIERHTVGKYKYRAQNLGSEYFL